MVIKLVRFSTAHMRPLTNAEQALCSLRDGETTSFQKVVRYLPRRTYINLWQHSAPQPKNFKKPMEGDQMSQDDEISVKGSCRRTKRAHDDSAKWGTLLTETPAPPQHPANTPTQRVHSPLFRGFQSSSSSS